MKIDAKTVAWVIAAEGTICFVKVDKWYEPKVSVGNVEEGFLRKFHEMVGRGKIFEGQWVLTGIEAIRDLLSEILHDLPIKREQAELTIEFCESRLPKKKIRAKDGKIPPRPYTKRERIIIETVRRLNHRERLPNSRRLD